MTNRNAQLDALLTSNIAKTMTTPDLFHVARAINAELEKAIADGVKMTQAHVGQIELANACTAELEARGYDRSGHRRDGADMPFDTCLIDGGRLSFQIRVF